MGQGSKPNFKVGPASSQVLMSVSSKYIFQLPAATGQCPLTHADVVCLPGQTQGISTSDAFSLLLSPLISLFSLLISPHTEHCSTLLLRHTVRQPASLFEQSLDKVSGHTTLSMLTAEMFQKCERQQRRFKASLPILATRSRFKRERQPQDIAVVIN